MSTWMVTSRYSPILRIGMRSTISSRSGRRPRTAGAAPGRLRRAGATAAPIFVTVRPERLSAIAKASASVALVTTDPSSTPRWTIVCAICGRMPLMMQSAPISRAAATVFSRCWAVSVSTVGTPVMSMMAIESAAVDDPLQQALHHDLGAGAVERADERQREHALPQRDDRGRELHQLLLLPDDHLLASALEHFDGVETEAVDERVDLPGRGRQPLRVVAAARRQPVEQRLLQRKHEDRRLGRREPLLRARRREVGEHLACTEPGVALDVGLARPGRVAEQRQKAARLIRDLLPGDAIGPESGRIDLPVDPLLQDARFVCLQDVVQRVGTV